MRASDLDLDRRGEEMTWGWLVNSVHESWPGVFRQLALSYLTSHSTSFLVAGKRSEARAACAIAIKAHRDPQRQTLCAISHPHSHYSLVHCTTALHIVLSSTAQVTNDCWVCQAIVPPTTPPHRHQNSPGDRSSASLEYLHLSSQDKHPSVHPNCHYHSASL